MADRMVEVVIAMHEQGGQTPIDCDEAIAAALGGQEEAGASADAKGGPHGGSRLDADGDVGPAAAEAEQQELEAPSAPPMPPFLREGASPGAQERAGQPAGSNAAHAQLDEDERLARSLHDEELRRLSEEQRERLTSLPSLLSESALVRTLSDKLLQSVPLTKLLPRVNGPAAAGARAEASRAGRARLEERLRLYCLTERQVKGDGACQFRALSDQLYRTPRLHGFVRECVCRQLAARPERYAGFVPGEYRSYCASMARSTTWGDHVTLQAAADYFGLRILVLASYESGAFLWIEPQDQRSRRMLWLSFWAELHYNSLYHADEPPPPLPDGKLLGSRRLHTILFG